MCLTDQTATITTIDDESVVCPFCSAVVLDMESEEMWEAPAGCPHLVCSYSWDAGCFATAIPAIEEWWELRQEALEETDDWPEPGELAQCPHVDRLVEHSAHGFACGPVCFTTSFGFVKESQK